MLNKVFLIGRLTRDPEAQQFQSQHTICRFSLAVNRSYSRDGEAKTDFINIIAWDKLAENCMKFLTKGKQVAVSGSIQTGSYERDGVKRQTFDIRADQVEFLSSGTESAPTNDDVDKLTPTDDDCPF